MKIDLIEFLLSRANVSRALDGLVLDDAGHPMPAAQALHAMIMDYANAICGGEPEVVVAHPELGGPVPSAILETRYTAAFLALSSADRDAAMCMSIAHSAALAGFNGNDVREIFADAQPAMGDNVQQHMSTVQQKEQGEMYELVQAAVALEQCLRTADRVTAAAAERTNSAVQQLRKVNAHVRHLADPSSPPADNHATTNG